MTTTSNQPALQAKARQPAKQAKAYSLGGARLCERNPRIDKEEILKPVKRATGQNEHDIAQYADRVVVFKDGKIKSDYQIEERRDAAEELKNLPVIEEDDDDEE